MSQPMLVKVGDKVEDHLHLTVSNSQIVSAVSRAIVNAKSVVTLTVPSGTIVIDEDFLTLTHQVTSGQQAFIVGA
jgi:hypothetical protein